MHPKISELLTKVNSLFEAQSSSPLSSLEFDLLQQHLRHLYELASEAQKQNTPATPPIERVKETRYEPIFTKPVAQAPSIPVKTEPTVEIKTEATHDTAEKVVIQKVEEVKTVEVKLSNGNKEINDEVKTNVTLNEKWVNSSVEIHQKLASKPLRELIDFNKRFAVVNELFKGDTSAFQQAVTALDAAENYTQAVDIYTQLGQAYNWDQASQTTRLFGKLIKQRFGVE